ncbi:DUF4113 domain-containing protein [Thalassospira sp.]
MGRSTRSEKSDWFMRNKTRSPCFTTRWEDIPALR